MLKKVLLTLAALIVVFLIIVSLQPPTFRVTRSALISAPAAAVFAQMNDFHKWEDWSPWAKLDPAMQQTYEGASAGAGAIYTWAGSSKVGEGKMTLLESRSHDLIRINLEFLKPVASACLMEFTFKPEASGTAVTWEMTGTNNFVGKAFSLFMNMDKMVGGDFEKGLAQIKSIAETARPK